MIAALATVVFLTTLWMLLVVGAAVLGGSGGKIMAAFKGEVPSPSLELRPVRVRHHRPHYQRSAPVSARQRAAA